MAKPKKVLPPKPKPAATPTPAVADTSGKSLADYKQSLEASQNVRREYKGLGWIQTPNAQTRSGMGASTPLRDYQKAETMKSNRQEQGYEIVKSGIPTYEKDAGQNYPGSASGVGPTGMGASKRYAPKQYKKDKPSTKR